MIAYYFTIFIYTIFASMIIGGILINILYWVNRYFKRRQAINMQNLSRERLREAGNRVLAQYREHNDRTVNVYAVPQSTVHDAPPDRYREHFRINYSSNTHTYATPYEITYIVDFDQQILNCHPSNTPIKSGRIKDTHGKLYDVCLIISEASAQTENIERLVNI